MRAVASLLVGATLPWIPEAMRVDRLGRLRQDTVDMFYHGYSNYMQHAFPEDELRPVSCAPLTRDKHDPTQIGLNDALGNYSLTLIDSLSTLAILAGGPQDGSYTGPQALGDFQDGIAQFVLHYGDGREGPSGVGLRAAGFDLDSKVQVFETVIRGVGGLLSAHLFATGELPIKGYDPKPLRRSMSNNDDPLELPPIPWPNGFSYDGQLLRLALDLAERLLPAFFTPTGIPYPRVNLRTGIPFYVNSPLHHGTGESEHVYVSGLREITETCSAGAGSLTLEFTVLSRLTGDNRFEQAAKRAFWEVWRRRSEIGLIGNGIDAERGSWIGPHSGIGAGMDSFFEYALKSHILLSGHGMPNASSSRRLATTNWLDPNSLHPPLTSEMHSSDAFLRAWHEAHASVKRHLYTDHHHYPYYSNSHRSTGQPYTMWIDSLGAFYPGLLALAGELDEAVEANLVYTALWTRYAALPERWSVRENNVEPGIGWWPGRPEFIESTYHIYRATNDPWYLHVGEMVLDDIRRRCHAPCGWAGLQDVRTGEKQDRMESFFLGETTKYMYLLFDPDHPLNKLDAAYVFNTEGHPLLIPKRRGAAASQQRRSPDSAESKHDADNTSSATSLQREEVHIVEDFTYSCPVPPPADPLSGSATAARPDLFHVSRFTNLYITPNVHGPVQAVQVVDENEGLVTRYLATSNHTVFPWTLPPAMLPRNGISIAPHERVVSWIEFPSTGGGGDVASSLAGRLGIVSPLVWYDHLGPTITNLDGIKLQLEREPYHTGEDDETEDLAWRISHIGNTQLGRHETVFFHAEHVRHFKDDAFTCLRRRDHVEISILVGTNDGRRQRNASMQLSNQDGDEGDDDTENNDSNDSSSSLPPHNLERDDDPPSPSESLLKTFLRAVSSVFDAGSTATDNDDADVANGTIYTWLGLTPTGPGAHPIPPTRDAKLPRSPGYDRDDPAANFPWRTIYMAGHACDESLPDAAPREHHVIVIRRGGCSFSEKLASIPSFSPGPRALQLVIIIDEPVAATAAGDDGQLPRPLLQAQQLTPHGLKRLHGIPMVLIGAAAGEYGLFAEAVAVGMRRTYRVESQGFPIKNAVVI